MRRLFRARTAYVLTLLALVASGCNDDDDGNGPAGPDTDRSYNQVQRLGNPLVSEVLLAKRSHPTHGSIGPAQDAALVAPEAVAFITGVAGRSEGYASTVGGALIPDVLIVQTDKDPAGAGWLTWLPLAPFSNGWGGRRLADDVTDLALLAVFGDPFGVEPGTVTAALTTDNVSSDSDFLPGFPYLGLPN
ncbi:MAG: DUF4331 family protein [Gemmatimonadales bacterium]